MFRGLFRGEHTYCLDALVAQEDRVVCLGRGVSERFKTGPNWRGVQLTGIVGLW